MFDHIKEYILKFNRNKIDTIAGKDHASWSIGISSEKNMVEDDEKGYFSLPCLANETANILVEEYCAKGMKRGNCENNGTSVFLQKL